MIEVYNIAKNINKQITTAEGGNVVTVVDNAVDSALNVISVNTFIDNLKVYAFIGSLEPVKLPTFKLEDSESDKLYKTLDIEWKSPRKQLDVLISGNGTDWNLIGSVSLLNPSGYPYRMYNLLDFFTDGLGARLGNNFKIGVQVKDVGYGVLSGDDKLTVHGSYLQEYVKSVSGGGTATASFTPIQNIIQIDNLTLASTGEEPRPLVDNEPTRKYLMIENTGEGIATLFIDNNPTFKIIINPGGNYELGIGSLYWTQPVYGVGDTIVRVTKGY
jgi:hypothetical protein